MTAAIIREEAPTHVWPEGTLIVWPQEPLFRGRELEDFVLAFVTRNPIGVRQADIRRALNWDDKKDAMTCNLLKSMVETGYLHREESTKRYFRA